VTDQGKLEGVAVVVDDHATSRESMARALRRRGLTVHTFDEGEKAVAFVGESAGEVDLVVTDLKMPGMNGLEVLRRVMATDMEIGVLLVTGFGTVDTAVEAMKLGAVEYLTKPVDLKLLRSRAASVIEKRTLARKVRFLQDRLDSVFGFDKLLGKSKQMQDLFGRIKMVGPTRSTVLITGESGTGKELIANALHQNSDRREKTFLPLNCSAIPRDILESEIFGHERGSFTGAIDKKVGKFELADGGTLFLDEIGDLAPETQVKLLRAIEELSFMRLGGSTMINIDTRVIAATNRDLEEMVRQGTFRSDLYYRLKVVYLRIAPLRQRHEDIPLLAEYFLKLSSNNIGRSAERISPELMKRFIRYNWPGNVRELRNLIESMVVLSSRDYLDLDDIPPGELLAGLDESLAGTDPLPAFARRRPDQFTTMEELERAHILDALEKTGGNRTKAADLLGIGLRTLHRKLKGYQDDEDAGG
jgi:DNA-binding NtrC family response regulator